MSQEQVAAAVTATGVTMHQSAVARIEKDQRKLTLDEAVALAPVLGVTLTELAAGMTGAVAEQYSKELDAGRPEVAAIQCVYDLGLLGSHRGSLLVSG